MSEIVDKVIGSVTNPLTGKSLASEGRIVDCSDKEGDLHVTYSREGIDPATKRKIEDAIVLAVGNEYPSKRVWVKTVSQDSKDVYGGKESPAALKTGHGTIGEKKRISGVDKVLCVSSCKGGVGKSTVAVNLALSLKDRGRKVGILDADIYGPSLPTLLNQREAKPKAGENKKIRPISVYDLKFISFGLFISESDPVIWRGPMLGGVLNQFLFDVEWGELDYLIVDLPPGTGDIQLSLVQNTHIDGALVVSTPQRIALLDTKKGLNMFKKVNVPILGMIENMSYFVPEDDRTKKYFIFGKGGVEKTAAELSVKFLGEIPLEIVVQETSDMGNPYMNHKEFEGRPVWKSYRELAQKVDGLFKENATGGFWGKFFG